MKRISIAGRSIATLCLSAIFLTFSLLPLTSISSSIIDPESFEKIWLDNNQRNIVRRYNYYNEIVQTSEEPLYLLGLDVGADKKIKTNEGIKDAIIDRLYIHYQSKEYLLLIDWFSAIPQPQVTEGYIYGDFIVGKTWQLPDDESYLTFGLRQRSTPQSTLFNNEPVFNVIDNASKDEYSAFIHLNLSGYDIGTYYSEDNEIENASLFFPKVAIGKHTLSSNIAFYEKNIDTRSNKHYEATVSAKLDTGSHHLNYGATLNHIPDTSDTGISNGFIEYESDVTSTFTYLAGFYYRNELDLDKDSEGMKLGLAWLFDNAWEGQPDNKIKMTVSAQRNAYGDFHSLIIPDELVLTMTLRAGLDF